MGRTGISIDWVSAGIFIVTYAFAQVTAVPLRVRYVVLALGCAAICGYRLQTFGTAVTVNAAITGAAAVLALYYLVKALMARTPGSR
ncbi:MAG: hypothetical protein QM723_03130 [Myxococcaceae bacterium]